MQSMNRRAERICKDIKALKIQGAHRVAREGFRAFVIEMLSSKIKTSKAFRNHAKKTMQKISSLRSTEPMLINYLDDVYDSISYLVKMKKHVQLIKDYLKIREEEVLEELKHEREKLAIFGADLVKNGDVILTHCHSTSVMLSLKEAKKQGKRFKVFCTESRPRYQGHLTARELASYNIDITLIVDSNVGTIINKVKKVFVGADAVDKNGNLANKVGSRMIAELAKKRKRIPFYSFTELYKYDKRRKIKIEQRDIKEVIGNRNFKGVKVLNPAFDIIPKKHIDGILTEIGLLKPHRFVKMAQRKIKMKPSQV